jgi:hypothetical protein
MIDCDACHRWFHGDCMGVDSVNPPSSWYCQTCEVLKQLESQQAALAAKSKKQVRKLPNVVTLVKHEVNVVADEGMIKKQLLLNFLASKSKLDSSVVHARQFYISQWYNKGTGEEEVDDKAQEQYYVSQWSIDSKAMHLVR